MPSSSARMPRGPAIGHRPVAVDGEGELLVLGADAELRLRLAARLEPRDEFVARLDRRHVDLVTGHAEFRRKKVATLNMGTAKGNVSRARARRSDIWTDLH